MKKLFRMLIFLLPAMLCYTYYSAHKYDYRIKQEVNHILKQEQESKCIQLLDLKKIFAFDWQDCYYFISNSSSETIIEKMQHPSNSYLIRDTPDDTYQLVFTKNNTVVHTEELSILDFTLFSNKDKITVDDAKFYVDKDLEGDYYLHQKQDVPTSSIVKDLLKRGINFCH
jgi:hypothetical protein